MSESAFTNELMAAGLAWLPASLLGEAQGDVINVLEYGATGNGVTDDTAAIQAAAAAIGQSGAALFFPTGNYLVSSPTLLNSNTMVTGSGTASTIIGVPRAQWKNTGHIGSDPYAFFANSGYGVAGANENILISNLQFSWINNQFQDAHAIRFFGTNNVIVQNCTFLYGGDNVTGLACNNFKVSGCSSFQSTGCPWDFFGPNTNVTVIDCYAESSLMQSQFCCFNASLGLQGPPNAPYTASGFKLIGCTFVNTSVVANAGSIDFDTLNATCTVNDVTITNNTFVNCPVHGIGNVNYVAITNNRCLNVGNYSAIFGFTDGTHVPTNFTVTGNQIINPLTLVSNLGVIRMWVNGYVVEGNTITGSGYDVAFSSSTFVGMLGLNSFAPGNVSTITGSAWSSVTDSLIFENGTTLRWYDATGTLTSLAVQSDSNMVLRGTDSTHASILGFGWQQNSTSASFRFFPGVEAGCLSSNFIRLIGGAAGANPSASPAVFIPSTAADTNVSLRVAGKGTGGGLFQALSITGPPGTSDIPSGYFAAAPDGSGNIALYYNKAGTIQKIGPFS